MRNQGSSRAPPSSIRTSETSHAEPGEILVCHVIYIYMLAPIGIDTWAVAEFSCAFGYSDEEIVTIHNVICQYQ